MNVERTYDENLIRCVVTMPEFWNVLSEDSQLKEDYIPPMNDTWLIFYEGDELIGLLQVYQINKSTIELHPLLLPKHRKKYRTAFAKAAFKWLLDNLPDMQKVNACVPEIYKNVCHYVASLGFQREGVNRQSFLKHGKMNNQLYFGITRQEIERLLV